MKHLLAICIALISISAWGQTHYKLKENIHYYSKEENKHDAYKKERCVLDIYYPENVDKFATIVWFHGGGLTGGHKEIPAALKGKNVAVIGVNYRLYPNIKAPEYIKDAAAAVAWTFKNIESFGGDSTLIFVSGHSAGGYLTSMIGLDKSYLAEFDIDANNIAGLIPFSGHAIIYYYFIVI